MNTKKKLTAKRERFCQEYIIDLNGAAAVRRAGYSQKGADVQAAQLLGNIRIITRLAELQKPICDKLELDAEFVLRGLKEVAVRCMKHVPVLDREGNETGEFTFNASGANRALELLGKHLKLFTEKHEHDTGQTLASLLAGLPFHVIDKYYCEDQWAGAQDFIGKCLFHTHNPHVAEGVRGISQYRKKLDATQSTIEKPIYYKDPVKDWTEHVGSALCTLAMAWKFHLIINGVRIGSPNPVLAAEYPQEPYLGIRHSCYARRNR